MNLKIVDKKRFILSSALTLILLGIVIALIFSIVLKVTAISFDEYEKIEVTIKDGDTLWNIANQYSIEEIDIRTQVDYIRQINNIGNSDHIVVGEKLLVPTKNSNLVLGIN